MYIERYLKIKDELEPGKTLVLLGPRRVGKTTLLSEFTSHTSVKVSSFRGDELRTQRAFSVADSAAVRPYIGSADVLVIDEAQAIPDVGQTLKTLLTIPCQNWRLLSLGHPHSNWLGRSENR